MADVSPDTRLEELIPREGKRLSVKKLKQDLGIYIRMLGPKRWVFSSLLLAMTASVVALFFNWRYGLAGLGAVIIGFKIAYAFGKEFDIPTVGELAKTMALHHYRKSRRDPGTVNVREVEELVRELFCDGPDLEPDVLTRNARF